MESRMRGNSHVRFGAGDEETCLGNGVRRFIPTLQIPPLALSLSAPPRAREAGRGRGHAACAVAWGWRACIQSAACWALPAAVKMARGSSFRTRSHEAT